MLVDGRDVYSTADRVNTAQVKQDSHSSSLKEQEHDGKSEVRRGAARWCNSA